MVYALTTIAKCKCCKKRFGFLTKKHRIIVAAEKDLNLLKTIFGHKLKHAIEVKDISKLPLPVISIHQWLLERS